MLTPQLPVPVLCRWRVPCMRLGRWGCKLRWGMGRVMVVGMGGVRVRVGGWRGVWQVGLLMEWRTCIGSPIRLNWSRLRGAGGTHGAGGGES